MIQEVYQKAIKFAGEKHKDQKVKGTNTNYLMHLSNVAMEILMADKVTLSSEDIFDLDYAIQVALLHDTLEDTMTSNEEISEAFGEEVLEGVLALTKDESLDPSHMMIDSLIRINELQKEVGMVKLADRITNLQEPPPSWSSEKITDYWEESLVISHFLSGKHTYLNNRLEDKIEEYRDKYFDFE